MTRTLFLSSYSLTVRICDHIAAVHLHEVWLDKKTGFSGAGTADDKDVLVPCVLRLLGTAVHRESFGLGEYYILGEHRVHIGFDVIRLAP